MPVSTQFGFHGKFHPNFGGSVFVENSPAFVSVLEKETSVGLLLHILFY
jgi:hypothetical protein